jgi:hypothetical protein
LADLLGYQSAILGDFRLPESFKDRLDSHWGFMKSKLDDLIVWVSEEPSIRKVRVKTTGHSLGGAQSSLMGLYARIYLEQQRQLLNQPIDSYHVEVFSFTPPRVMPINMAKLTQALLQHPTWAKSFQMHIFSNDRDPVARAPITLWARWSNNVYHPVPENFIAGNPNQPSKRYIAHVKHDSSYDAYTTIGLDNFDVSSETLLDQLGTQEWTSKNQNNLAATEEFRRTFPYPPKRQFIKWIADYNTWTMGDPNRYEAFFMRAHQVTQFLRGHWADQGTPTQRYYTTRMDDIVTNECLGEYDISLGCRDNHGSANVTYDVKRMNSPSNIPRIANWHRVERAIALNIPDQTFLLRSASNTSLCLTADFDSIGKVSFQPCVQGAKLLHQLVRVSSDYRLYFPYSTDGSDENNNALMCLQNSDTSSNLKAKKCNVTVGFNGKFFSNLDVRGFAEIGRIVNGNVHGSTCLQTENKKAPIIGTAISWAQCVSVSGNVDAHIVASQAFLIELAPQSSVTGFSGQHVAIASKAKNKLSCLIVDQAEVANYSEHDAKTGDCKYRVNTDDSGGTYHTRFRAKHRIMFTKHPRFSSEYAPYYVVGGTYKNSEEEVTRVCLEPDSVSLNKPLRVKIRACSTNWESTTDHVVLPVASPSGSIIFFQDAMRKNKSHTVPAYCWNSPELTDAQRNVGDNPNRGVIELQECEYDRNNFESGSENKGTSNVEWYVGSSFTDARHRQKLGAYKIAKPVSASARVQHGTPHNNDDHCDGPGDDPDASGNRVRIDGAATAEESFLNITQIQQNYGDHNIDYVHTIGGAEYKVYSEYSVTPEGMVIATVPHGGCNQHRVTNQTINYTVKDEFGNEAVGEIDHYTTDNLAYGKPATQSSTYNGNSTAGEAVDGNKSSDWGALSVSSTNAGEIPWWQVDLQGAHTVKNVRLYNYAESGSGSSSLPKTHLENIIVEALSYDGVVLDSVAYSGEVDDFVDLHLTADEASFVRVTQSHVGILQLAEVEVAGWRTGPVVENVALNKPATQSSTESGEVASKAVDGNTYGNSITHTRHENKPWWSVDLEGAHTVKKIKLFNRLNCCQDRLTNFKVILDRVGGSQLVLQPTVAGVQDVFTFPTSVSDVVRVTVQLNGTNYLSLAEVQVFGWKTQSASVKLQNQQSVLHKGKRGSQGNSELACPAGYAITGYTGYGKHLMSSVKFRCHKIGTDGKWGTETWTGEWGGDNSGGGNTTRYSEMCSQDKYVTSIYTRSSKAWIIDTYFECGKISLDIENKNRSYRYNPEDKHINMTGSPNKSGWSKDNTVSSVCENNNVNQNGKYARVFTKANVGRKWRGNASAHVVNEIKYYCDQVKLQ